MTDRSDRVLGAVSVLAIIGYVVYALTRPAYSPPGFGPEEQVPAPVEGSVYVVRARSGCCKFRLSPDTTAARVRGREVLLDSTPIRVINRIGDWLCVATIDDGSTGYVRWRNDDSLYLATVDKEDRDNLLELRGCRVSGRYASGHWVKEVGEGGSSITLEDGSIWEVSGLDMYARSWLPGRQITILYRWDGDPGYPDALVNTDDAEVACVRSDSQR